MAEQDLVQARYDSVTDFKPEGTDYSTLPKLGAPTTAPSVAPTDLTPEQRLQKNVNIVRQGFSKVSKTKDTSPVAISKGFTDRYFGSKYADELGVSLTEDNESRYDARQTAWDTIKNNFAGMAINAVADFNMSMAEVPYLIGQSKKYAEGDASILDKEGNRSLIKAGEGIYDNAFSKYIYDKSNQERNKYINYDSQQEADLKSDSHWYNPLLNLIPFKGTAWSEITQQTGHILGIGSSLLLQDAAVTLATGGAGGVPAIATTIPRFAGRMMNLTKLALRGEKTVSELAGITGGVEKAVSQASNLKRVYSGYEVGNTGIKLGIKPLWDLNRAAYGEAALEALETKENLVNVMKEEYLSKNGKEAEGDDLAKLYETTQYAANSRFALNMALLGITNTLSLNYMFKGMGLTSALVDKEATKLGAKIAFKEGVASVEEIAKPVSKWALSENFAKSIAGKSYDTVRNSSAKVLAPSEAFEEIAQSVIQKSTDSYYKHKYNAGTDFDLGDIFSKTLEATKETLTTTEGWNSALQGLLGGSGVAVISGGFESYKNGTKKVKDAKEAYKKDLGLTADYINKNGINAITSDSNKDGITPNQLFALNNSSLEGSIEDKADELRARKGISQAMETAAKDRNNAFEYNNLKQDLRFSFVDHFIKNGQYEYLKAYLKDLKDLAKNNPDAFNKAFLDEELGSGEGNIKKVEQLEKLADKNQKFREDVDLLFNRKFSKNDIIQKRQYDAFKTELVSNKLKVEDFQERLTDLNTKVGAYGEVLDSVLNQDNYDSHIASLSDRIKLAEDLLKGLPQGNLTQANVLSKLELKKLKDERTLFERMREGKVANRKVFDYIKANTNKNLFHQDIIDLIEARKDAKSIEKAIYTTIDNYNILADGGGFDKFVKNTEEYKTEVKNKENAGKIADVNAKIKNVINKRITEAEASFIYAKSGELFDKDANLTKTDEELAKWVEGKLDEKKNLDLVKKAVKEATGVENPVVDVNKPAVEIIAENREIKEKENLSKIDIVNTPSKEIIDRLLELDTFQEKLDYLKNKGLLVPINVDGVFVNAIDYSDRVMVLIKLGDTNMPFYISTGQAGKKTVAAGKWYPIFGLGQFPNQNRYWINKGTEEDINNYYQFPIFEKVSKILNEGIGQISLQENDGKIKKGFKYLIDEKDVIDSFNAQMNLGSEPVMYGGLFYNHVTSVLAKINNELSQIKNNEKQVEPIDDVTAGNIYEVDEDYGDDTSTDEILEETFVEESPDVFVPDISPLKKLFNEVDAKKVKKIIDYFQSLKLGIKIVISQEALKERLKELGHEISEKSFIQGFYDKETKTLYIPHLSANTFFHELTHLHQAILLESKDKEAGEILSAFNEKLRPFAKEILSRAREDRKITIEGVAIDLTASVYENYSEEGIIDELWANLQAAYTAKKFEEGSFWANTFKKLFDYFKNNFPSFKNVEIEKLTLDELLKKSAESVLKGEYLNIEKESENEIEKNINSELWYVVDDSTGVAYLTRPPLDNPYREVDVVVKKVFQTDEIALQKILDGFEGDDLEKLNSLKEYLVLKGYDSMYQTDTEKLVILNKDNIKSTEGKRNDISNDFTATTPFEIVLKYFIEGGRVAAEVISSNWAGLGEKGSRKSLIRKNDKLAKKADAFGDKVAESQGVIQSSEKQAYQDAVYDVLNQFSTVKEMRDFVNDKYGNILFKAIDNDVVEGGDRTEIIKHTGGEGFRRTGIFFATEKEANAYIDSKGEQFKIHHHSIEITPELRKSVEEKGQPLFKAKNKISLKEFLRKNNISTLSQAKLAEIKKAVAETIAKKLANGETVVISKASPIYNLVDMSSAKKLGKDDYSKLDKLRVKNVVPEKVAKFTADRQRAEVTETSYIIDGKELIRQSKINSEDTEEEQFEGFNEQSSKNLVTSAIVGTHVDTIWRHVLKSDNATFEDIQADVERGAENINTQEVFNSVKDYVMSVKEQIKKEFGDVTFFADKMLLMQEADDYEVEYQRYDGRAGEPDFFIQDSKGNVHLFEVVTKYSFNRNNMVAKINSTKYGLSTVEKVAQQLKTYSDLLEVNGIPVKSRNVIFQGVYYKRDTFQPDSLDLTVPPLMSPIQLEIKIEKQIEAAEFDSDEDIPFSATEIKEEDFNLKCKI